MSSFAFTNFLLRKIFDLVACSSRCVNTCKKNINTHINTLIENQVRQYLAYKLIVSYIPSGNNCTTIALREEASRFVLISYLCALYHSCKYTSLSTVLVDIYINICMLPN